MQLSLDLLAERLRGKGHDARTVNAEGARFSYVRLLAPENDQWEPDTLYVASCLPAGLAGDEPCSFALLHAPVAKTAAPCLIVESVPDETVLANAVAHERDSIADAIARIAELAWEPDGLQTVIEALSQLANNPVYIVDSSFKVMAITHDPDMEEMSVNWMHAARHGYLSYDLISNLIRSNELHDIESSNSATIVNSEFFYVPFINYNLRQRGRVQGHLFVVQMYKVITASDLEVVDLVAPHVLRALQAMPAYQARRGPLYEHFVIDWLEGGLSDAAYVRRQLDALSFDAQALSVVAAFELASDGEFRREQIARLLEDRQDCRAVSHDGTVIALFQLKRHKQKEGVLRKVRGICQRQQCRAFVSDVQDSFLDTPRGYRQVRDTMRICDIMGIDDIVVNYGDVAAYQPYLNFTSIDELESFCHPAVMTLRNYDSTHAVQLLPTLSAFLKNDRDVQATARELYVHRNTLMYRMKKILEMCPVNLDDFLMRHRLLESILIVENYDGIASHLR